MDFTILAVVLLIGVGIPVRNKLIRKYREEKKKQDKNRDEKCWIWKKQSLYAARSVEIKRATKLEKILF